MTEFEAMLRLFGCAIWSPPGNFCRTAYVAAVGEQRKGRTTPDGMPLWDRDAASLKTIRRYGPDGPLSVPEWWALPWVVEDMLRLSEDVHDSIRSVA